MGITYSDRPKQPYEEIPDYVDFVNRIPAGETISSATVTCADSSGTNTTSSMIKGVSYSGTKVYFTYFGGEDGKKYKASIRVVSATAKKEEDFMFDVAEM